MSKRVAKVGYFGIAVVVVLFCLWLVFGVDHKSAETALTNKYLDKASYSFITGEYICVGVEQDADGNKTGYLVEDTNGRQFSVTNTNESYEVGSTYTLTLGSADFSNTSLFYSSDSEPIFSVLTTANIASDAVESMARGSIKDSVCFEHFLTLFALGGLSVIIGLVGAVVVCLVQQAIYVRELKLRGIDVT